MMLITGEQLCQSISVTQRQVILQRPPSGNRITFASLIQSFRCGDTPVVDVYDLFCQHPTLCFSSTRHDPDELQEVIRDLAPLVVRPQYNLSPTACIRRCFISTENRITMVLVFLSHYDTLARLAYEFHTSIDAIFHDVHHITPLIIEWYGVLIHWPDVNERRALEGEM